MLYTDNIEKVTLFARNQQYMRCAKSICFVSPEVLTLEYTFGIQQQTTLPMGDSMWKAKEKHNNFFSSDFWLEKSKELVIWETKKPFFCDFWPFYWNM